MVLRPWPGLRRSVLFAIIVAGLAVAAGLSGTPPPPAAAQERVAAEITAPPPDSTLTSGSIRLSWSAGSGVDEYWLDIGTSQASNDIFSASQGLNRVLHLRGLPTDGSPVWARVWSRFGEEWEFRDAAYTVRIPTAEQSQAEITSPEPGSTLTSGTVTFTWSAGSGANGYLLRVGTSPGGDEIFSASQSLSLAASVGGLPTTGGPVFVRLFTFFGAR